MKVILRTGRFLGAALLVFSSASCGLLFKDDLPETISGLEHRVFELVNSKRAENGLEAMAWNDAIADAARSHSRDMADGTVPFGHDGYEDRFAAIRLIIPAASAYAENVAYAWGADTAFALWMDSAGHRDKILGDYDYTGVGAAWSDSDAVYYFTEIFIRSR